MFNMFFTFIYLCVWAFFGIASKILSEAKGWEYSKKDNNIYPNIDWVFFTLLCGPWTFLVLCAMPARWSIPEEEHQKRQNKILETFMAANRSQIGFFKNLVFNVKKTFNEFLVVIITYLLLCIFPLAQIAIILEFGFNWNVFDFLKNTFIP